MYRAASFIAMRCRIDEREEHADHSLQWFAVRMVRVGAALKLLSCVVLGAGKRERKQCAVEAYLEESEIEKAAEGGLAEDLAEGILSTELTFLKEDTEPAIGLAKASYDRRIGFHLA